MGSQLDHELRTKRNLPIALRKGEKENSKNSRYLQLPHLCFLSPELLEVMKDSRGKRQTGTRGPIPRKSNLKRKRKLILLF